MMKKIIIFGLLGGIIVLLLTLLVSKRTNEQLNKIPPIIYQPSPNTSLRDIPLQGSSGASPEYKKEEAEFIKKTPILQKLPAISPFFTINYVNEQYLIIKSDTPDKERDFQSARNWFVENDIDISNIKIEYK